MLSGKEAGIGIRSAAEIFPVAGAAYPLLYAAVIVGEDDSGKQSFLISEIIKVLYGKSLSLAPPAGG